MQISYTNLLAISDELIVASTKGLKAAEAIREHVAQSQHRALFDLAGPDGGPDPLRAIATATTTVSHRSAICSATATGAEITNEGVLDIRAGDTVRFGSDDCEVLATPGLARAEEEKHTAPRTYGDVLPGLMRWLKEHHPDKAEELERDGDLKLTGQSEPQTRVRVRDELVEIIEQCDAKLAVPSVVVDRILDRLIEGSVKGTDAGWATHFLRQVKRGEL